MTVYVALLNDRHTDPTAYLFSDADRAIAWARATAKGYDTHGDYSEEDIDGWLFYARYSSEGDSIWVVETEFYDG